LSVGSFILDNYYLLVLFLQGGILSGLMIYLGRFDPKDLRTAAFRRVMLGTVLWAFFDFAMDYWGKTYPDEIAFDLYRYSCFLFLIFPSAASELIVSLQRKMTWSIRALIYSPFIAMYLTALAFPDIVTARMFGIQGGYQGAIVPWNTFFKAYTTISVFALLGWLAVKAWQDADPITRREKLVLAVGGTLSMSGILVSQLLKGHWPFLPWLANLATLTTIVAAVISLKRYGRVLSPQAMYRITLQVTPAGMLHLHGDKITWAGASLLKWLDYDHPDELANRPVREILVEDDNPRKTDILVERMVEGSISDEEVWLKGKQGTRVPCLVSGAPFDPADPSQGVLMVFTDITDYKQIEEQREELIASLRDALHEVKTLRGFFPICASCKKIRDDEGYWQQIEEYIEDRSEAQFSHSICPDCRKKLYPELSQPKLQKDI
jgi:PAS domain S-box-containing protein